ncbi:hypothetical protein HKL94_01945 [Candidatus Parcubacteria bacterium]|nr:hypothetical protein [Candidatus Parcubacteria bacterium]
MDNISNVIYVDAAYSYSKDIGQTKLAPHEAYGYVERSANNIIIIFIKKRGSDNSLTIAAGEPIIKGLVLPDTALVSIASAHKTDLLKGIAIDSSVAITWRDVRYVANVSEYECAVMNTKGIVYRIENDHIVIKDPQTTRTYPNPVKNHPEGEHPTYLMIPVSFITGVSATT